MTAPAKPASGPTASVKVNDQELGNASQTQIVFEPFYTYEYWMNHAVSAKRNSANLSFAKSILLNEGLTNDFLSVSPIQLFEKLIQ